MTSLVLRKVRSGGALKLVPIVPGPIIEGVVKLERVSVICPACGQQVQAVATDGRVKGYCAVVKQDVDFLVETQHVLQVFTAETRAKISAVAKKHWQDPEYQAEMRAARKKSWQDPEYQAKQSAARIRRHNKKGELWLTL